MSSSNKVVIIGGGVSGLAAGCVLARRGVDVTVFEANEKLGGCCTTTKVGGYTFHDGAVYLAAVGLLDYGFTKLGLDRATQVPLRKIVPTLSVTLPDGAIVTVGNDLDVRVEGRAPDSARLQAELRRMLRTWGPVLDAVLGHLAIEPFSPWRAMRYGFRHLHKFRGTVASEIRRLITDEPIRAALAGALLHTGLPPNDMPIANILGLISTLRDGLFLPEGGMGRISDALSAALQGHGGQLRFSSPVRHIVVEDGRVHGVRVAEGDQVEAAGVISTVSPMSTFTSLVDRVDVPASMTRRIESARLSHRAVSIQLGLANIIGTRALLNLVVPMLENQDQVLTQDPRAVTWPVYSVPTMILPELAPSGGSIVEMFVPVSSDVSLEKWEEGQKEEFAESAVRALRRFHDLDVAVTRVRTPRDFRDQMHLHQGALYGLSPAVPPQKQFAQTSPIHGLLLAGQSTYPGYGVAPAIMSGIFAADAMIASVLSR